MLGADTAGARLTHKTLIGAGSSGISTCLNSDMLRHTLKYALRLPSALSVWICVAVELVCRRESVTPA